MSSDHWVQNTVRNATKMILVRLWRVCLQMFSSSRHRGFGGRKGGHVICGCIISQISNTSITLYTRIVWDPQTRYGGWVGAWSPRPVSDRSHMWQGQKTKDLLDVFHLFANFGSCGLPIKCNFPKITYLGLVQIIECRNFGIVTVTSYLCRNVKLIQHVTVTGVCWIDQNGTVVPLLQLFEKTMTL